MAPFRSTVASLVGVFVLALLGAGAGGANVATPDVTAYSGLGTWIDIYSPSFRADPGRLAAALEARGVHTLFVETGNFRQRVDVVGRKQLGGLIEASHALGIDVVAWYLPDFANPARAM